MNCRIKTKTGTVFFKRCHFPLTVKCDPVKRVNKLLFKKYFKLKKIYTCPSNVEGLTVSDQLVFERKLQK